MKDEDSHFCRYISLVPFFIATLFDHYSIMNIVERWKFTRFLSEANLSSCLLCFREEIDDLTEQLNQKKVQLEAFGKTLRELEEETR